MTVGVDTSHRIAELALGALKEAGLPATPRNFEVWYAHVEGRNPSLSRDIQISSDGFGRVPQTAADELYRQHVQHADLSQDVIDLVTRFQAEVTDLHVVINQTGENAQGANATLTDLTAQLRQTTEEYPAVGALLEGVIAVARDMRTQNEILESRLEETVNEIDALQQNVQTIQAEASKDALTGVANRSTFDKALQQQMAEAKASGDSLALILADIDHFKTFNDTFGHQTGDQVLRLVAEVMNANVKGQDLLARYGGEEFAVVLPGTALEHAHMLADRIRRAVESRRLRKRKTDEDLGVITMSLGVAVHRGPDTMESFIERADECLYAAKENGRNQVVDEKDLRQMRDTKRSTAI